MSPKAALFAVCSLALAACQSDNFQGLIAKIAAKDGTPTATDGHYLINFGEVLLNSTASQTLTLTDVGQATLAVTPPVVTAPFGTTDLAAMDVSPGAFAAVPFTFTPTKAGPASQTVSIKSNGGTLTVDLEGVGTTTPPVCTFTVEPMAVDFGVVQSGMSMTSGVRVSNTGNSACAVSAIQIAASSDAAFTLVSGQSTAVNLPPGAGGFPIGVVFAPPMPGTFSGTLTLQIGPPGTTVTVPLSGLTPVVDPPPDAGPPDAGTPDAGMPNCTFSAASPLAFGNVQEGQSSTKTFEIVNTGSVPCAVSSLMLDATSAPEFTLVAGQAASGTIAALASMTVGVTFTPTALGSFTGAVDFDISPPSRPFSVKLTGDSMALCGDPNPDGTCPIPTAPIYLNDGSSLYSYDPSTNIAALLAGFSTATEMFDIGINKSGTMYGVGNDALFAINPVNAACLKVATLSNSPNGLTVLDDGDVIAAGSSVQVINGTTYAVTTLVPANKYSTSGDIVLLPDGNLYWSVLSPTGASHDELIRVNPTTGATTDIGRLGAGGVYGLAYYDNVLYGFTSDGGWLSIDPMTAATISSGSVPGDWYGATTNPKAQ